MSFITHSLDDTAYLAEKGFPYTVSVQRSPAGYGRDEPETTFIFTDLSQDDALYFLQVRPIQVTSILESRKAVKKQMQHALRTWRLDRKKQATN